MNFVTAIKRVVAEYLDHEEMADVVHATYTGTGIRLDDRPNEIDAEFVDIPLSLQSVEATLSGTFEGEFLSVDGAPVTKITLNNAPVIITRGLIPGDRVTVARQRGGQRFSILDRTGGPRV